MAHLRKRQVTPEGHALPSSVTKTHCKTKFVTMLHAFLNPFVQAEDIRPQPTPLPHRNTVCIHTKLNRRPRVCTSNCKNVLQARKIVKMVALRGAPVSVVGKNKYIIGGHFGPLGPSLLGTSKDSKSFGTFVALRFQGYRAKPKCWHLGDGFV